MISVLYVDDEPDLLELGKVFLERDGSFNITTAESGEKALSLIRGTDFDAVVSDFQMPEMDGISLLRQIRQGSDVPFILFTGKGREEVVINAINSGADFYLQKGGDPAAQFAELGHKIVQAVSRRKAEQALHKRLAMIKKTAEVSARFIQLRSGQVDGAIDELLAAIGTQAGADHCFIAMKTGPDDKVLPVHEWTAQGILSHKERSGTIDSEDFSWIGARGRERDLVHIASVASMPSVPDDVAKQKACLQALGIRSFLAFPLNTGPEIVGSLGLDTTEKEVTWPEEDIDIFRIYGQIIASALGRKAADQLIRESEELYRTVFESTGTAMMILEEDKTVAVVNRELERISGFGRSEVEGKMQWTRFVDPKDLERMKQYHVLRRTDPSAVPKNYEFGFLARDGRRISTYITVEMIPDKKKSIVSLIDISREKVAQQALVESEEKFRNLAESLPEGIYMIQDSRFVYVNPAFCRLFVYTIEEIMEIPDYTNLFVEEDRPLIRKNVADRLAGIRESTRYMRRGVRRDGAIVPVIIHGSRTQFRGKPAIIGTVIRAGNECQNPSGQLPDPGK